MFLLFIYFIFFKIIGAATAAPAAPLPTPFIVRKTLSARYIIEVQLNFSMICAYIFQNTSQQCLKAVYTDVYCDTGSEK